MAAGPYRYISHPIYAGMLLAILGSAFVTGRLWLVVFAILAIYFLYSARTEEHLMLQHLPEQYTEYKSRTKAFIPFVV